MLALAEYARVMSRFPTTPGIWSKVNDDALQTGESCKIFEDWADIQWMYLMSRNPSVSGHSLDLFDIIFLYTHLEGDDSDLPDEGRLEQSF